MREGSQGRFEITLTGEGDPINGDYPVTSAGGVGLVGHGRFHPQSDTPMRGVSTFFSFEAMGASHLHVSDSPSEGGKPRADQSLRKGRRLRFPLENIVALYIPPT